MFDPGNIPPTPYSEPSRSPIDTSVVPPHVVLVTKYTSYRHFLELCRNDEAQRRLFGRDATVAAVRAAHEEHRCTLRQVEEILRDLGVRLHVVGVPHQPFSVRGVSLVVTVGGDGTLLAASHQCDHQTPIVGINSAPSSSVGFFCGLKPGRRLRSALERAMEGTLHGLELARMEVRINRKLISRRVLNDALFCHASPAATSRYIVQIGEQLEIHKSSGFWIGPAAGSTAAQYSAGGRILPITSKQLQFVVRDPYLLTGRLRFSRSVVREGEALLVFNRMRDAKVYLDGPHTVVDVGVGSKLQFSLSTEPLHVLGLRPDRGRNGSVRRGFGGV